MFILWNPSLVKASPTHHEYKGRQPQQDLECISSFWLVCDPMDLIPGCVNGDSMEPPIGMPNISDIVIEEQALVRPTEPPPHNCSPEKRAPHTCWTWVRFGCNKLGWISLLKDSPDETHVGDCMGESKLRLTHPSSSWNLGWAFPP